MDSQLVTGILNNDERAWRHICRNMKTGFMAQCHTIAREYSSFFIGTISRWMILQVLLG